MYESINYYCCFRETTQEEAILHDAFEKISRLHQTIETYEVKPKTLRKDIKKEDIVGVLYVSNPQPSMCTIYSYLGLLNHQYIQFQDNAIFKEGIQVKETFETLTSFLVDSYAPSLWTYPKTKYDIIDGHEYEIMLILKNNQIIKYEARQEYFKSFNTLMHLLGSHHRDAYDDIDEDLS
jgi:hypothetical protein